MKPTTPVALTNSDIEPETSLRFQSNRKKEDMDKRRLKMRQSERNYRKQENNGRLRADKTTEDLQC